MPRPLCPREETSYSVHGKDKRDGEDSVKKKISFVGPEFLTPVFKYLGYNASETVESQPTFRRNILPPSSSSNNKLNKK
jgi:hypothetical protein